MRASLVSALCSCVVDQKRKRARRFLQGLSSDELQYIAEFLGSCILEAHPRPPCTRGELAEDITRFERCRRAAHPAAPRCRPRPDAGALRDNEHKMILLLEYLCRSGLTRYSVPMASGHAG